MQRFAIVALFAVFLLFVSNSKSDPPIYSIPSGGGGLPPGGTVDQHLVNTAPGTASWNDDYHSIIEDEGTPLTKRKVVNFVGAGVSCVDDSGDAETDCTIAGGGGGAGDAGEGSSFGMTGNATTTNVTPIDTFILMNGTLTEDADPSGLWAVTSGKAEVCYTGPTTGISMTVLASGKLSDAAKYQIKIGTASGSPVSDGDEVGVGYYRTESASGGLFHVAFHAGTLLNNDCFGLMVEADVVNPTFKLEETQIVIDVDPGYNQLAGTAGGASPYPINQVMAESASGINRGRAKITVWPNGGLWIEGGKVAVAQFGGVDPSQGNHRVLIGRMNEAVNGTGVTHGSMLGTLEVISKNHDATMNHAIRAIAWDNDDSDLIVAQNGLGATAGLWTDDFVAGLYAIGYFDDSLSSGPVVAIAGSGEGGATSGTGWSVVKSGDGGGGQCVASQPQASDNAYADRAALIADGTCIANDPLDTCGGDCPNGALFLDYNGDGVFDVGPEDKLAGGGGPTLVHFDVPIDTPVVGRWNDLSRVRSAFNIAQVYCKTDQGTATIQVHADSDGVENDGDTLFATAMNCDATHAGVSKSTFDGNHTGLPTILAGRWMDVEILTLTGSPGFITIVFDE